MKNIFLSLILIAPTVSLAQEIFSGSQLGKLRADSYSAETNKTFFIIDNIAGNNIYTFNFLAKPDTRMSEIARKVLGPTGLPEFAQDAHCTFSKTLKSEQNQEEWKVYSCKLVENKVSTYPTWYE